MENNFAGERKARSTAVPKLAANHQRSISVSLRLLDQALCEWERWARGDLLRGVVYQQKDTLSPREKKQLNLRIATIRQRIAKLHDELELDCESVATSQLIVGRANVLWEMLAELNSRLLAGYGNVSAEMANYLDPIAEEMAAHRYEISRLLSSAT
jgi:hypothetical protein